MLACLPRLLDLRAFLLLAPARFLLGPAKAACLSVCPPTLLLFSPAGSTSTRTLMASMTATCSARCVPLWAEAAASATVVSTACCASAPLPLPAASRICRRCCPQPPTATLLPHPFLPDSTPNTPHNPAQVFTEHTHIAAVRPTGNVYCFEALDELCLKPKNMRDLLTGGWTVI